MASIFLAHVPNRFSLAVPRETWLKPIQDYDSELRIFPSQTQPCFRLMRVASHSGGMSHKIFKDIPGIHPDTKVALENRLVAVCTIPPMALDAPPDNIVMQLRRRDQWAIGGGQGMDAGDKIADMLDRRDADNYEFKRAEIREEGKDLHRGSRISFLYRTGARVSLVRPPTYRKGTASPSGSPPPVGIPPAAGTTTP